MRTKKVNRYFCDFCKRSGGSAYHMRRHEVGCTANPERECGMCEPGGYDAAELPALVALLPDGHEAQRHIDIAENAPLDRADGLGGPFLWSERVACVGVLESEITQAVVVALPALREAATECPACMLAALRQSGCARFSDFDWKVERERFLADAHERRWEGVAMGGLD